VFWQENLLLNEVSPSVGVAPGSEVPRQDGVLVVARGGFTGGVHTIADPGAKLFGSRETGITPILVISAAVRLRHEVPHEGELALTTIPPGWYAVLLFETDGSYAGPDWLRPRRSGAHRYIERLNLVQLVGVGAEDLVDATTIEHPSHRLDVLSLSTGERAWLEGPVLRAHDDRRRDRFYVAEAGGFFVHERSGQITRLRLPREAFRLVWL
jgi:hypothetical protein